MEKFKEAMAQSLYGRSRKDPICVTCGSDKINPADFKDDLSRTEFGISRMCQECQDGIFEGGEDDE